MNEKAMILRKIKLKQQSCEIIKEDCLKLMGRLGLILLKEFYEKQTESDVFDPLFSRKLDCLNFLLDE